MVHVHAFLAFFCYYFVVAAKAYCGRIHSFTIPDESSSRSVVYSSWECFTSLSFSSAIYPVTTNVMSPVVFSFTYSFSSNSTVQQSPPSFSDLLGKTTSLKTWVSVRMCESSLYSFRWFMMPVCLLCSTLTVLFRLALVCFKWDRTNDTSRSCAKICSYRTASP